MVRGPLPLVVLLGTVCVVAAALVLWLLQDETSPTTPARLALPDDLDVAVVIDAETLQGAPLLDALGRRTRSAPVNDDGPFRALEDLLELRTEHAQALAVLDGELAAGLRGDEWLLAVPATTALGLAEWSGTLQLPHADQVVGVWIASSDAALLAEARDRLTRTNPSGDAPRAIGRNRLELTWRVPASAPALRGLSELRVVELVGGRVAVDQPAQLHARVGLGRRDAVEIDVELACLTDDGAEHGRDPPQASAPALAAEPGATFVQVAVVDPADLVLDRLVDWLPPPRRRLFHESLVERGSSWEELSTGLSSALAPGASLTGARLAEADALELDRWDEGHVQPLAGTTVRFRWRSPTSRAAFEAHLAPHLDLLLGDDVERQAVAGAELIAARRPPLDLGWSLFQPALLLDGQGVTLASHRDQLLRVLENGDSPSGPFLRDGDTWGLTVDAEPLAAFLDDLRWEHAEVSTNRDWGRVRREVRAELERREDLDRIERATLEDRRVDELIRRRNEVEFPAAVQAWRRRFAWLARIDGLTGSGRVEGRRLVGRFALQLR